MSTAESPPQDLGDAQLDADDGRVSIPDDLAEWEVLSPGSEAYWAWDPTTERVHVTRSQRALDEHADLTRIDETRVTDEGRLALPDEFTADGDEYPWSGYFAGEDTVYFDAPGNLLSEQLVYALPEGEHQAFWND